MALEMEKESRGIAERIDTLMQEFDRPAYDSEVSDSGRNIDRLAEEIKSGETEEILQQLTYIRDNAEKREQKAEAFLLSAELLKLPHQQREDGLLTGKGDMFGIYQLRENVMERHDYAFASMDFLRKHDMEVKAENYELVYAAPLSTLDQKDTAQLLEQVFERFNIDRPEDFAGHSLSMSDVVLLHREGENTSHYTDRAGFEELPDFARQREQIVEQQKEAERSGLVSVELPYGVIMQYALDKGVTSEDVLGILADSKEPYKELSQMGKEIGDIDYAVFEQSENCTFSIDYNMVSDLANVYEINGEKGGIAENDRTDDNISFTQIDLAAYRTELNKSRSSERPQSEQTQAKKQVIQNKNTEQKQHRADKPHKPVTAGINHENRATGGDGRNDNVTDYDELFRQDIAPVYEGENPQLFTEQVYAMMTGRTVDGAEIADRPQENFSYERNFDYIVQTYHDNGEAYHDTAENIEIGTIYGPVALASVSQDDMGRFNLMDYQYTGRLKEDSAGLEAGQLIVFTAAEILSAGIQREDGGQTYGNTALMNEAFEEMSQIFREPDSKERTFRCYVENDKSAFDVTFFRHEGEKRFYIEDTGEYPMMMGEGTVSDDFEFTAYNAKEFLNEFGEDFGGKREFVVFDIHEPEVTQAQIENAERMETLPVQLNVDMSLDNEAQPTKHFYFNDEQEAKRFAKTFQKEMQEFSDTTGIEVAFESSIGERDDVKRDLQKRAENYEESPVVKAFREKTDELFHELAGNNAESIEQMVKSHVQGVLDDYGIDAVVVDAVLAGSRSRGIENEDSDVDVVVEYYGDIAEDSLFDMINEDYLEVAGYKVDINPITEDKTGTLETYLPEAESYLNEKAAEIEREQQAARQAEEQAEKERTTKEAEEQEKRQAELALREKEEKKREAAANNSYANFKLQKHIDDEKYDLIADVKGTGGEVRKDVAIAEFPDKKAALAFCVKNKIQAKDITNYLQSKISHKKHLTDEKGKDGAGRDKSHSANQSME